MFRISTQPIDLEALRQELHDVEAGAQVSFEGRVRRQNDHREVGALDYEAYVELAEKEGGKILEEARTRFGVLGAVCVHRVGHLEVGDLAVWVGVTAAHRGEAFEACRYIIDETKARVPIWKKEHYTSGTSTWINSAEPPASGEAEPGRKV